MRHLRDHESFAVQPLFQISMPSQTIDDMFRAIQSMHRLMHSAVHAYIG